MFIKAASFQNDSMLNRQVMNDKLVETKQESAQWDNQSSLSNLV
jgi:hypothetical protein